MARKSSKGNNGSKESTPAKGQADLLRSLWQVAVNLRGAIEPADYNLRSSSPSRPGWRPGSARTPRGLLNGS
jgi:hypothetical protein